MDQRKSNIELLRIVSILMIISFHCAYKSGFQFETGFNANKLIVKSLWMLGELGVNLFMLISGYFMVNGRFKPKKMIRLLVQAQFYYWLTLLLGSKVGVCSLPQGKREIFLSFFPVTLDRSGWFLTVYILIYLFSPYLNLLIRTMDEKTYRRFLLTSLTLFCVLPTFFGFFFNTTEALLYYNRFIWLMIIYFLGAYIYIYDENKEKKNFFAKRNSVRLTVASTCVIILSILVIDHFSSFFAVLGTTESAYFWQPNTIPMLGLSIGVFGLFLRTKIPCNSVINAAASTTLGIYLLHDGLLQGWLWHSIFRCAEFQNSNDLILHILAATVIVFLVGMTIDLLRQQLEKFTLIPFLNAIERCLVGAVDGNHEEKRL